ncbi:MAG TPA: glycerol-3-phosphate 1-O-acyltransferase PlsY [Xanthomonadaceae bacterium]
MALMHTAALLLAAYLLGSLSGSLLLGRLRGVDIRTMGSGNAGGTNAFRTQGAAFALGVVAVDIGKGALAAWMGLRFAPASSAAWLGHACAFAAVVGHVWPVWHGFRGGKGAATAVGALVVLWPLSVPVLLAVWIATLVLSGYVGLATVLAGLSAAVLGMVLRVSMPLHLLTVAIALLLVYTHRANLARLRAGTESRFDKARLLHRLFLRR